MIGRTALYNWKKFCREPVENIKGYEEAISNPGVYVCHHLNELTFSREELKKMNMYYHRPASELIILSHSDHAKWHRRWNGNFMKGLTGEKCPRWKGDSASASIKYRRARKSFLKGEISKEEYQFWVDSRNAYRRERARLRRIGK